MIARPKLRDLNPSLLIDINFALYSETIIHSRIVYGWLDLLGDLGGVSEIIGIVFGFFLLPVSYHSFIMKASQHLYYARTKDNNLFRVSKKDQAEREHNSKVAQQVNQAEEIS